MTRPTPGTDPVATFAPGLFAGRTAVVTGGGTGIGRRTAVAMARLGADVVVAGRDLPRLQETVEDLRRTQQENGYGDARAEAHAVNIRDVGEVERLREETLRRFGAVDFLVNNAGGQFPAPPSKISDNGWRSVVDLNLNGTWNMLSRFMTPMSEAGYGAIVNVVHIYSLERGAPYFVHSGAARAGVVNLTRSLAPYLAPHGVTVNALAPGTVDTTGFLDNEARPMGLVGERGEEHLRSTAARRMGTPDEVAATIVYLCSPAARFVTGAVLVADGGEFYGNWPQVWEPGTL